VAESSLEAGSRSPGYALGHSDRELRRLSAQANVVSPITRRFFEEAGIAAGMRVLDVGSGAGDVAFLAADLVGVTGEVVGTDKVPAAVATARQRAEEAGFGNVSFREGDPAEMDFERPFDAVVGRYILQYYADTAATLHRLARHVRPGGLIVFHERDWYGVQSFPPSPTYDRCCRWIIETFEAVGIRTRVGLELHAAYVAAGLPAPALRLEAVIGGSEGGAAWLEVIAETVRSILPEMERLGLATAAEVAVDTLADRLQREVAAGGGIVIGRTEIGAWSRV
jgi:SAM-dependent methyltransferase